MQTFTFLFRHQFQLGRHRPPFLSGDGADHLMYTRRYRNGGLSFFLYDVLYENEFGQPE